MNEANAEIFAMIWILYGFFLIYRAMAKPNFFWNQRRVLRVRHWIGDDGVATAFYVLVGIIIITISVWSLGAF